MADLPVAPGQRQGPDELVYLAHGQGGDLDDVLAAHAHAARFLAQARATALGAWRVRHVAMEFVVDRLEILVGVAALLAAAALVLVEAALQIGQHALELLFECMFAPVLLEGEGDLLARRQLVPRLVEIDVERRRHRVEDLLEKGAVAPLPGIDSALAQAEIGVDDHQIRVEIHGGADAIAGWAGAGRVVEREQTRTQLGQAHATVGAGEFLREQEIVALEGRDLDQAATQFGGQLDGLGQALLDAGLAHQTVNEDLYGVLLRLVEFGRLRQLDELAVDVGADEALLAESRQVGGVVALLVAHHGRQHREARAFGEAKHAIHHLGNGLGKDALAALPAVHLAGPCP